VTGFVAASADDQPLKFDFGSGRVESGYAQVLPANEYSPASGFGFEPGGAIEVIDRGRDDPLRGDFCTSNRPFYFSVKLPEGNYRVTVTLGDLSGDSTTTVKAELRRLMLENVKTAAGKTEARSFIVNVRTPQIVVGGRRIGQRASQAS
jgi:fibronectin type 3 domain-containing protein